MAATKAKRFMAPRHWSWAQRLAHYSKPGSGGCVLFTGTILGTGYGQTQIKGKRLLAHRAAWIAVNGTIPEGKCVCHICDVRNCINIGHLFLGTHADNNADMTAKGRAVYLAGEACASSKLTEAQARAILADARKLRVIAAIYGITESAVSRIKKRKNWKYL